MRGINSIASTPMTALPTGSSLLSELPMTNQPTTLSLNIGKAVTGTASNTTSRSVYNPYNLHGPYSQAPTKRTGISNKYDSHPSRVGRIVFIHHRMCGLEPRPN